MLGEERQGLSSAQRGLCTDVVSIPMVGAADSLNLAVAGSLLMYEVYRGRSAQLVRATLTMGVSTVDPYSETIGEIDSIVDKV